MIKGTIFFVCFIALCVLLDARQNFSHLRSTYTLIPIHGFHELPRTSNEAFKQDYVKVGSCGDGSGFLGERFILPSKLSRNEFINMELNPYYQMDNAINGHVTTAYFIDPDRICTDGRSQIEFDSQGTGYTLIFQKGSNEWFEHGCWFNMGKHYAEFNHKRDQSCDMLFPGFITYHNSMLHGFAWMHYGKLNGSRYEHPHKFMLSHIVKKGPRCLYKGEKTLGISAMHIYFKSHKLMCQ
ncbi:unnamed protein product [Lepeophtheirus salmonis]|uniref:(salmon louse) hypothetical protein n=1 Tax=Lepeophtheirus salmonis TaxID=72036 RepID=A0A7R8D0Z6_LEPSM|nr:unnamed protein product [Lepeophtheirus salmonis]CAF2987283.1 unnamed protein product [Lepeophtheirus salmonis]